MELLASVTVTEQSCQPPAAADQPQAPAAAAGGTQQPGLRYGGADSDAGRPAAAPAPVLVPQAAAVQLDRDLVLRLAGADGAAAAGAGLRVIVWDFGGQEVFYALHHLYLTSYAAYTVLFDMQVRQYGRMQRASPPCLYLHSSLKISANLVPFAFAGARENRGQ